MAATALPYKVQCQPPSHCVSTPKSDCFSSKFKSCSVVPFYLIMIWTTLNQTEVACGAPWHLWCVPGTLWCHQITGAELPQVPEMFIRGWCMWQGMRPSPSELAAGDDGPEQSAPMSKCPNKSLPLWVCFLRQHSLLNKRCSKKCLILLSPSSFTPLWLLGCAISCRGEEHGVIPHSLPMARGAQSPESGQSVAGVSSRWVCVACYMIYTLFRSLCAWKVSNILGFFCPVSQPYVRSVFSPWLVWLQRK